MKIEHRFDDLVKGGEVCFLDGKCYVAVGIHGSNLVVWLRSNGSFVVLSRLRRHYSDANLVRTTWL